MWSDNETKIDLLDYSHLLAVAKSVINSSNLLPATIGIFGDWGSGKTSLMKMLEDELIAQGKESGDVLCISFNGWLFEGYEDAKTALMSTILLEIEKFGSQSYTKKLSDRFIDLIKSLRERINWMRLSLTIGKYAAGYYLAGGKGLATVAIADIPNYLRSIDFSDFLKTAAEKTQDISEEQISKYIKDKVNDTPAEETIFLQDFHRDFQELINETGVKTMVVFIDDLDRCTPDTIIGTLEAIKLFLFTPQTVFVIGADEDLVRYSVKRRFPEIQEEKIDIGRDYLEKLIQYPVRIPRLSQVELELYIHLLFVENAVPKEKLDQVRQAVIGQKPEHIFDSAFARRSIHEALGTIDEPLSTNLSLASQIAPVLAQSPSGNPRQTKRFLNTLMMRLKMAKGRDVELQTSVLAKLMLLEYIKLHVFRDLADLQGRQEGKPIELKIAEERVRTPTTGALKDNVRESGEKKTDEKQIEPDEDGDSSEITDIEQPDDIQEGVHIIDEQIVESWLKDEWLKSWMLLEPAISDIDLRPYFFFSRDRLESVSATDHKLNPRSRKVLSDLLGTGDITRRRGQIEAKKLSQAEASTIFTILSDRIYKRDDHRGEETELDSLMRLVSVHKDLGGQLITVLRNLPEKSLPVNISVRLENVLSEDVLESIAMPLFNKWAGSDQKGLAAATKQTLERLEKVS